MHLKDIGLKKMTKYCEAVVDKHKIGYKDIEVRDVYYLDRESGKQLIWEKSGNPYVLVSFNAINNNKLGRAV